MTYLPLTPPGHTPLRVMTIAGSDSGGGAGIQADLRTFAMLGIHGLVAATAVTVQNSVGVKGFHEIPLDVIAGQISAVASDIGVQAAKTGMLASSAIIETIADTWRSAGLAGTVPLVVDPVCASMHGDSLLHPITDGVIAGLVVGKPLGVFATTFLLAKFTGASLDENLAWRDVLGVSLLAGIGFTVSLFFATAAFPPGPLLDETKMGALISFVAAGVAIVLGRLVGLRSARTL